MKLSFPSILPSRKEQEQFNVLLVAAQPDPTLLEVLSRDGSVHLKAEIQAAPSAWTANHASGSYLRAYLPKSYRLITIFPASSKASKV